MSDPKNPDFKVSDRRMFNPDGSLRDSSASNTEANQPDETASARVLSFPGDKTRDQAGEARSHENGRTAARPAPAREPGLDSLINMLAVEAAMHLGLIENPGAGLAVDLDSARHIIDIFGALERKTAGNLTPDEADLLENVLADLRAQFVAVSKKR